MMPSQMQPQEFNMYHPSQFVQRQPNYFNLQNQQLLQKQIEISRSGKTISNLTMNNANFKYLLQTGECTKSDRTVAKLFGPIISCNADTAAARLLQLSKSTTHARSTGNFQV